MKRIQPADVVSAYQETLLIPIRNAWDCEDFRGGCALEAVAQVSGIDTQELFNSLDPDYRNGFLNAWDADEPEFVAQGTKLEQQGYWDGMTCRSSVEATFSSDLVPVSTKKKTESA